MLDVAQSLPDDPDGLRRFTALLLAEVKSQAMLIEKLRHQLAGHRSHRFGTSSETIEQLQLALEASEISIAKMTATLRLPDEEKDKPKRRPIPDRIPRQEIGLTTGHDDCFRCGGTLRRLGEDVTEEPEYVPGRFIVNRIVRPRFACSGCEAFTQAPLPSRPIERGRPGPGLLAHVLVNKCADHLPLYRQSQIFERDGLDLDRSTLAGWVGKSTALLEPLADAIGRHVLAGQAIFADDTPVKMLAPGTGRTATARLWAYGRDERPWGSGVPPARWYRFSPDRKGEHPKDHLAGYSGWMHADGYGGFEDLYRSGDIREVARHWLTSAASSSTCTGHKAAPSPTKPSPASHGSTPSRKRRGDRRRTGASRSGRPRPRRSSTASRPGCTSSCPASRASPRWPRRSATRSPP